MVRTHSDRFINLIFLFVDSGQHSDPVSGRLGKAVPLLLPLPVLGQVAHGRVLAAFNMHGGFTELGEHGVADKLGANKFLRIPGPAVAWITAAAMDSQHSAAIFQIGTKYCALLGGQDIAADIGPDQQVELLQILAVVNSGIFRVETVPAIFFSNIFKQFSGRGNSLQMAKAIGLGEDQYPGIRRKGRQLRCYLVIAGFGK